MKMRVALAITRTYMVAIITDAVCALAGVVRIDATSALLLAGGVCAWLVVETLARDRAGTPRR